MKHEQALAHSSATPAPAGDFAGHWENELQSTMDLVLTGDRITGQYTSHVSGGGGQITGAITGSVAGNIITFFVNWGNASITSWIGHLVQENGAEWIETLWQLAQPTQHPTNPNELWTSILAGADRFHR